MPLVNRELITVKEEVTYNTDPTPSGANAVLVENLSASNEGARMIERRPITTTLAPYKQIFGGTLMQLTFDVEIKGSGTAGTAPEYGDLLEACGFSETVVAVTSVTYDPASTGIKSCTIWYYQDGLLTKMTGCRGNVSFNLETGNKGMMSFTMTGHVGTVIADVALATPTYQSTVPPAILGQSFTIDAYAATINALSWDMNNTIATPPDINAADGYGEILITARDVSGTFDPELELVATEAFDANWRSGKAMALAVGAIGATAGNICTITMPAVSYREVGQGDRDGIRTLELGFGASESSGDDEVSIAFT